MKSLIQKTRENFSFAWSKFAKKEVGGEWYKDSCSYLMNIPEEIFKGGGKPGLDAGRGSGADMKYISRYDAGIIGIDISDSIRFAGENIAGQHKLRLVQADIYGLPFKDGAFDFVYSFGALYHLPFCCLPYQIFKRIKWTRKLAGKIPFRHTMRLDCLVSDLYDRFSPPIEYRYNRQEVGRWFEQAGFEDVNVNYYRGWVAWGRKP